MVFTQENAKREYCLAKGDPLYFFLVDILTSDKLLFFFFLIALRFRKKPP